jgi:hypothetical protein
MAKRNPTLATLEPIVLDEMVSEGLDPWKKQLDRLRGSEPGRPEYRDALCQLWILSEIIGIKAKIASEMIDEYLDVIPEDD